MKRKDILELRTKVADALFQLVSQSLSGMVMHPQSQQQLGLLTMMHSALCRHLKSMTEVDHILAAVSKLDAALGVLTDLSNEKAQVDLHIARIRNLIHDALGILEG